MAETTKAMAELGSFLKARRAELTPDHVDLAYPSAGMRRVVGLRREEVAVLARISTDYYTRLEQGRLSTISEQAFAAVCRALQLNADQEKYARALARKPLVSSAARPISVDPVTRSLLAHVTEIPALALGSHMNVLAWNDLASALYLDFAQLPPEHRNLVWLAFLEPRVRDLFRGDWDAIGRACVAFLRMDAACYPDDLRVANLVRELSSHDDDFRSWWTSENVAYQHTFGRKQYQHSTAGELTFDWQIYQCAGLAAATLMFLIPAPNTPTAQALNELKHLVRRA